MRKRKEGRNKRTRETPKRESEKGGGPKKAKKKQRETQMPFFRGKTVFCLLKKKTKKGKQRTKTKNTKKQKENKEGLGPSEVALWATSPDP